MRGAYLEIPYLKFLLLPAMFNVFEVLLLYHLVDFFVNLLKINLNFSRLLTTLSIHKQRPGLLLEPWWMPSVTLIPCLLLLMVHKFWCFYAALVGLYLYFSSLFSFCKTFKLIMTYWRHNWEQLSMPLEV